MLSKFINCQIMQNMKANDITPLSQQMRIGDIIFNHIDMLLFRKVAKDTGCWANHVGIVIDMVGEQPVIAESCFPFSTTTTLERFIKRSRHNRIAVYRLGGGLAEVHYDSLRQAAQKRMGIFYDTGFNLHSRKQFCSRFVHEVLNEAANIKIGKVQTLKELLQHNPDADLLFWKIWYFGRIPWQRQTITPASIMNNPDLELIFDVQVN
jgi:hypothetical protein